MNKKIIITEEEYAAAKKFNEEWEKYQANKFVIPRPPKITLLRVILRGKTIQQHLDEWQDEDLCRAMISERIFEFAKKNAVEDVLMQFAQQIRANSTKLSNCTWRWKAKRFFRMDKNDSKTFMRECKVTKNQMRGYFKYLAESLLPPDFLGSQNTEILCNFLTEYMYVVEKDRHKQKYPVLSTRQIAACRAMRCKEFRKAVEEAQLRFGSVQTHATWIITSFTAKYLLAVACVFLERLIEFKAGTFKEEAVYYVKWGYLYWAKREYQNFKTEYKLKTETSAEINTSLLCKIRMTALRGSIRPLCIFKERVNIWMIAEMRFLNQAMDYFIQLYKMPRYEDANMFKDVGLMANTAKNKIQNVLVRNYLRWKRDNYPDDRFYFMTFDVAQCFSTVNQTTLKELLLKIVGNKTCVVARVVYPHPVVSDKFKVCYRNGQNSEEVKAKLIEYLSKCENLKWPQISKALDEAIYKTFNHTMIDDIMTHVNNLKFQMGARASIYTMFKGVPQGFILSTRLAHIYLLNYDRDYLLPLINKKSMLFRYVDDYLIITNNKTAAKKILKVVLHGNNRYGINFKKEKIKLSFPAPGFKRSKVITWCGQKINTENYKMWYPVGKIIAKKYPNAYKKRQQAAQRQKNKHQMSSIGLESSIGESFLQFCGNN